MKKLNFRILALLLPTISFANAQNAMAVDALTAKDLADKIKDDSNYAAQIGKSINDINTPPVTAQDLTDEIKNDGNYAAKIGKSINDINTPPVTAMTAQELADTIEGHKSYNDTVGQSIMDIDNPSLGKIVKAIKSNPNYEKTIGASINQINGNPNPEPSASVKNPLSKFGLGAGLAFDIPNTPLNAKLFYGFGKSKLHGAGAYYGSLVGLRTGLLFVYGNGKSKYGTDPANIATISEKMPAAFVEFIYDFSLGHMPISPYLAGRLGYAKHKLNFSAPNAGTPLSIDKKYNKFAYGLGLGTQMKITNNIAVDLSYNVNDFGFKSNMIDISGFDGAPPETMLEVKKVKLQHSANLLVKFSF